MRTNEERITALHSRALELKRERRNQQLAAFCALSGVVCLGLSIGIAVMVHDISAIRFNNAASDTMSGSIFSGSDSLVYIVIGILAFLLGVTVTVLCFRMKKWMDEKDREDL